MIAKGQTYKGIPIFLDGSTFEKCRFVRCTIVFSGILGHGLISCSLEDCRWEFAGPAQNTLAFLKAMYTQGGKEMIEGTFDSIRGKPVENQPTLN